MYDSILVPTDGSDGGNGAVKHSFEIAERFGATIHTQYVVDTDKYGEPALSSPELVIDELEEEEQELLDEIAERGNNLGIEVTTRCVHGSPHEVIIQTAAEVDADVIVMGYQGKSHTKHIGSVTDRVLRSAGRPVLAA